MSTEQHHPAPEGPASLEEVSDAMVGLYRSQFGRGSRKARSYWCGPDAITCFMEDTPPFAERDLVTTGESARVRDTESLTRSVSVAQFCEPVERITGRTVRSLHSSVDAHLDGLSTETFVFYPEGREGPSRGGRTTHPLARAGRHAVPHAPSAPGSVAVSVAADELTAAELATVETVRELVASGTLEPLTQALRSGEQGLVDARDVLRVLVDFDRERLVEITLDTLITRYVEQPPTAPPPRRPDTEG